MKLISTCWSEAETFGVGSFCVGRRAQYIAVALRATGVGCRRRIRRRSLFVSSADFALVHARGDARLAATHRWQSLSESKKFPLNSNSHLLHLILKFVKINHYS